MFIVLLKFSENKSRAGEFMPEHNDWLQSGFDDGVFLLAGSLKPGLGGGILADNEAMEVMQKRVNEDPFVREKIVTAEVIELEPGRTDDRLSFFLKE